MIKALTEAERKAVDAYLDSGGRVYTARTGESGLYDETGLPLRPGIDGVGRHTRARVQAFRRMKAEGATNVEIAEHLGISLYALRGTLNRWAGWDGDDK